MRRTALQIEAHNDDKARLLSLGKLNVLPDEIIALIFGYLGVKDVPNLLPTS